MEKYIVLLFYFTLTVLLLGCDSGEGLRGIYSTTDESNNSLEFISGSKIKLNLDGERFLGTYKITDKTILINIRNTTKLVLLTLVDKNTIVRRLSGAQIFTKK
jgi:hypothetical protein